LEEIINNWSTWTLAEWNEALFNHYFLIKNDEDTPVFRIPFTNDELTIIVSASKADPHEIEESFLKAIRTKSHLKYNRRLSQYCIDSKLGWNAVTTPPFFVELAFSCLVASPVDGEIRDVGDFRKRLTLLLGHDQSIARYPLRPLSNLWVAFSQWLDWRRESGEPFRRLELPPLDYRVLIGYSINLAFPSRRDQKILTQTLSGEGLDNDPPIPTIFDLVGSSISEFSSNFKRAYEEFREAFRRNARNLEQFPFWGAVREALVNGVEEENETTRHQLGLKLVMEPGGIVLLLSTKPKEVIKNNLAFMAMDTPHGEFGNVLCTVGGENPDFKKATLGLLKGEFDDLMPGKGWRAIKIAVEEGILLFKKTESSSWQLTFTRQDEGEYKALVEDYLEKEFTKALPNHLAPDTKPSSYSGWAQYGRFPGRLLGSLSYSRTSILSSIRCMQPLVSRSKLFLIGGCKIDGGYLGLPACFPIVRAPGADSVRVIPTLETKIVTSF